MTIHQAIQACDNLQPNPYENREKLGWLCGLEARIWDEVLRDRVRWQLPPAPAGAGAVHAKGGKKRGVFRPPVFDGWENRGLGEALLLDPPHDQVYALYLLSQVDFHNGEWGRYNNTAARFNQAWAEMARSCNHRWIHRKTRARNY